ncbi:MAG: transglycosylase domain-containing protein [Desulfotomaculales bacterium]
MPKRKKLSLWRLFLVLIILLAILGFFSFLGLVAVSLYQMPAWSMEDLDPGSATVLYDRDGRLITRIGAENRESVPLKGIPPVVRDAFIAVEDVRFYEHPGVDLRAIARAAWNNLRGGRVVEGGSTITQQLVKNSFLKPERTWQRKIQEVVLALMVERRFTKDEILEMYLNRIYLGEGAYGVQAAAQVYFGKNVSDLNLPEAALLAGLTKAPSLYSPFRNPEGALERRNLVLDNMLKYNLITAAQHRAARATPLRLNPDPRARNRYPYPYFVDYVTEELIARYGETAVFRGGLKVYTTLDPKLQQAAEEVLADARYFPKSERDANNILQPQAAVAAVEPNTGYIRALVGGREHTHKRSFNRATMPPGRPPGSAFKPIIDYGPAIEFLGKAPASVVDDIPTTFGNYAPRNYDGRYRGLITYREALTYSVNVAAVKVLQEVGLPQAIQFAGRLGFTAFDPARDGLSLALGGMTYGVTPLQMAAAYAAFAANGIYAAPMAVTKVERPDGTYDDFRPARTRAMKPTTAYLITSMLQSVVERGTGTRAALDRPVAGKTGTSDEGRDAWFVGYTPDLAAAVWLGYDQPRPMPLVYGGSYAAPIWKAIVSRALSGTPPRSFAVPEGIVSATVDSKSGLLPGPNTPPEHTVTDLFAEGTVPTKADDTHVLVEIDPTTGLLATPYCPERVVRAVVKLPYSVPSSVEDYEIRMPQGFCTAHREAPLPSSAIPPGTSGPPQGGPERGNTPPRQNGSGRAGPD